MTSHNFNNPFEHVIQFNPWDDDTYQQLLDNFPHQHSVHWKPIASHHPYQFGIGLDVIRWQNPISKIQDKKLDFWRYIGESLLSDEVMHNWLKLYNIPPSIWHMFYPTARICMEQQGYQLGPFRDRNDKVISVTYQLAPHIDEPDYPIQLLKPKQANLYACRQNYPMHMFDVARICRYRPNTAVSWFEEDYSYYHIGPIGNEPRRTIRYFIRYK